MNERKDENYITLGINAGDINTLMSDACLEALISWVCGRPVHFDGDASNI